MKRWTNGLPGATKRLGAKMALRGLAASQPRMRADTHDGPEQIAPLQRPDTLMQLSRSLISEVHLVPHGRAIHFGTKQTCRHSLLFVRFRGDCVAKQFCPSERAVDVVAKSPPQHRTRVGWLPKTRRRIVAALNHRWRIASSGRILPRC